MQNSETQANNFSETAVPQKSFFVEQNVAPLLPQVLGKSGISESDMQKYNPKDLYYYLFENVFYHPEVLFEIQKNYLKYIPQNSEHHFLDVGCGRGEFLDMLTKCGIKAKGIEINALEVDLLQKKGFDVVKDDVVSYLKNSDEIFSGISATQVVEHLEFEYLYEFVHLAYERIANGGVLLLETLNPRLLNNLKSFYNDLTHVKPVPYASLIFLCEFAGFKNIKICHSLPAEDCYVNYALICYKSEE